MTEMYSPSIAHSLLRSVTTTPSVFELKSCRQFRGCDGGYHLGHHRVVFGDLAGLKSASEAKLSCSGDNYLHRHSFFGNYSISVIHFNERAVKPMIIFHLENVDPSVVAEKVIAEGGSNARERDSAYRLSEYVPCSKDWFSPRRFFVNTCGNHDKEMKMDSFYEQEAFIYNVQTPRDLAASLNLVWKVDPKDVANGTGGLTTDLANLFYFVNGSAWFERHYARDDLSDTRNSIRPYYEVGQVEISVSTGGIYELRARNEKIGIAINPWDVFGDAMVCSELIGGRYDCYALVLHEFNQGFQKVFFPIESCVYGNVYRSFYKSGEEIENPFYGHDDDTEFARLPEAVFIKILSYLPWRHRFQCRRVNRRWLRMANLATAIDTKVIDLGDERYDDMRLDDLNRLLPIVSHYVEEFWSVCSEVEFMWNPLNFEGITFPNLRKIHINEELAYFDDFFSLLNNCPNLKELTAPILRREFPSPITPGPYIQVEKLCLFKSAEMTDPWLFELTSYFPKLTTLHIDGYDYLSSSCLSAVVEKYGKTLTRFKINGYDRAVQPLEALSMIGALTGVGQCPNMEYCSLVSTAFISNPLLESLAAGCTKLATLNINSSLTITNEGLAALASLPNLKRLDISTIGETRDLSAGISQLAKAGHLEQLIAANASYPSADCLKICVRHCRRLKLLDITGSTATLNTHDAKGIIRLYGTWSLNSRLTLRSSNKTWRRRSVRMVQNEVAETVTRRFIVDLCVWYRMAWLRSHPTIYRGRWLPDDDIGPASQDQSLFYGWSGDADEQSSDSE